ncbi:MAG: hypothetical protein ACPLYD_13355 [Anaerolineae bacterium]
MVPKSRTFTYLFTLFILLSPTLTLPTSISAPAYVSNTPNIICGQLLIGSDGVHYYITFMPSTESQSWWIDPLAFPDWWNLDFDSLNGSFIRIYDPQFDPNGAATYGYPDQKLLVGFSRIGLVDSCTTTTVCGEWSYGSDVAWGFRPWDQSDIWLVDIVSVPNSDLGALVGQSVMLYDPSFSLDPAYPLVIATRMEVVESCVPITSATPTSVPTPILPTIPPISTSLPTPTAFSAPVLEVSDIQIEPSQVSVSEMVRITMVIENRGAPLNQPFWQYTGEVILENESGEVIDRHSFSKGDASFISPVVEGEQVNFEKWLLTVKVRFKTAVSNGVVVVSLQPDIQQQSELRGEGRLTINPGLSGLSCTSVIVNKLIGPFSSDIGKDLLDAVTAGLQVARCEDGDIACAVPPLAKGFVKILGRAILGSIGKIITGIWGVFDTDALQVCEDPVNWMWQLVREFNRQGVPISVSGVHSPMTILVTNAAGQRAGFVSDDEVVTEIPDSRVIEWEGDKYVIYPADPNITISLQATGDGSVGVTLIEGQSGREFTYSNVSVSDGDRAQVDLKEPQPQLVIDTNNDGNPDEVYSGTAEMLRALETPTASPPTTSRPTGVCGVSLGLIMLPLFVLAVRRFRKFVE